MEFKILKTNLFKVIEAYKKYWTKAFDFKGKTSRKDFWFAVLANYLVLLIYFLFVLLPASLINENFATLMFSIYSLYVFAQQIPSWSMSVRRLRDSGKAWQWVFINFVLLIGNLYFVYLLCKPSLDSDFDIGIKKEPLTSKIRRENLSIKKKVELDCNEFEFITSLDASPKNVYREFEKLLLKKKGGQKILNSIQLISYNFYEPVIGNLEFLIKGKKLYIFSSKKIKNYRKWIIPDEILYPQNTSIEGNSDSLKSQGISQDYIEEDYNNDLNEINSSESRFIENKTTEFEEKNIPFEKLKFLKELFLEDLIGENDYKKLRLAILSLSDQQDNSEEIKKKFLEKLNFETKEELLEIRRAYDKSLIDEDEYDRLVRKIFKL